MIVERNGYKTETEKYMDYLQRKSKKDVEKAKKETDKENKKK